MIIFIVNFKSEHFCNLISGKRLKTLQRILVAKRFKERTKNYEINTNNLDLKGVILKNKSLRKTKCNLLIENISLIHTN